jgi:outer membrane murein-binding lipoprotein Lpp
MEKNLKLIIGILAAAAVILCGVLFYVWHDRNAIIGQLTVEKGDLTEEVTQLKTDYATLSSSNDTLNQQLMVERSKVDQLIEKIKKTESGNKLQLLRYEKEIGTLRTIMRSYIKQIDSLNTLNMNLRTETAAAKQEAKEANDKYNDIKVTTDEYAKQVEKGSVLRGRGVTMIGITSNGKETDRSGKISRLKTCLSLVENSIAKKGPRTVYIRIKGPDGILMTNNQQNVFIVAGEQMLYSASREVDYEGDEVEICIYFAEGGFTKGTYTVDAYTAEGKLGSAQTFLR